MSSPNMIKLKSNDDQIFEVEDKIAKMSTTVKTLLHDLGVTEADDEPVPLPNVNGAILKLIIKWCDHHKNDPPVPEDEDEEDRERRYTDEVPAWDADFLKVDQSTLFELMTAANYLDIKPLLDVACQTVANMMRGKSIEDIRKQFDIENDFTPEEEEKIRKENEWLEEK